jgi:hypothetical protein
MQNKIFKSMTRLATRETASSNTKQLMQHGETLPILASKASVHCEVLRRGYSPSYLPEMRRGCRRHVSGCRIFSLESRRGLPLCGSASRNAPRSAAPGPIGLRGRISKYVLRHLRDRVAFAYAYREDAVAARLSGIVPAEFRDTRAHCSTSSFHIIAIRIRGRVTHFDVARRARCCSRLAGGNAP